MTIIVTPLAIPDVKLITPTVYRDERGYFQELYNAVLFREHGLPTEFVQDNLSHSKRGVLRGLHYQIDPYAQGKLVTVLSGCVFDVAVDIRPDSSTYGQWVGHTLCADRAERLWIPPGFAHGFLTLEDDTLFMYKCTHTYHHEADRVIAWNDATLQIDWPLPDNVIELSDKDRTAPSFEHRV